MAYGIARLAGKDVQFGFSSVADWFDSIVMSFPAPWSLSDDTHYGTVIVDARGRKLFSVWLAFGEPSARQRDGMSDDEWAEYCTDSHWESETQWHLTNAIVAARNAIGGHAWKTDDRALDLLRHLIMQHARWDEAINAEIVCGGPDRRMTDDDPALAGSGIPHLPVKR